MIRLVTNPQRRVGKLLRSTHGAPMEQIPGIHRPDHRSVRWRALNDGCAVRSGIQNRPGC